MTHPLMQWAHDFNITPAALTALLNVRGAGTPVNPPHASGLTSEAAVQQQVRLEAARRCGLWLMRNNVGACEDKDGRVIRYGLCNDSRQMNEQIKSSDLVGIETVTDPVSGFRYGVFSCRECKKPGWKLTPGDKRGQAQLRFGQMVIARGGIFKFVTSAEEL